MLSFKVDLRTAQGLMVKALKSESTDNLGKGSVRMDGLCSSCKCAKDTFIEEVVKCAKCKSVYHSVCLLQPLSAEFIKQMSSNPCTWWLCPTCIAASNDMPESAVNTGDEETDDGVKHDQTVFFKTMSDKFLSLKSELMSSLNTSIDSKLDSILSKLDTPSYSETPSYSDIAWRNVGQAQYVDNQSKARQQVVVISPSDPLSTPEKSVNEVKQAVAESLKTIPTNFVVANGEKGSVTVAFPNENACEKGSKLLENLNLSSSGFSTKQGRKMLPKLVITGNFQDIFEDAIVSDQTSDQQRQNIKKVIKDSIILKNISLKPLVDEGHTLDIVYINQSKNSKSTIVLKVSPSVRLAIMEGQRRSIYIGNMSYLAEDRFHIRQCFHCQKIGHVSAECPDRENSSVCFYCRGSHKSKECPKKKNPSEHSCAKCFTSLSKSDRDNHNAASPDCPVIQREVSRIASNTEYHSKNMK